MLLCSLTLVFALAAGPARASDGVLEINSTCATATGCFSGDSAGYPVTITTPGSYRLTGNLVLFSENVTGITISTSDVAIDLNGFAIIRFTCVGVTTSCRATSGTGTGISVSSTLNRGISVKNGSITGMGTHGVALGAQAEVTNVRVRWNRLNGISVGEGSTVTGNTAFGHGEDGINTGNFSTISYNTSIDNVGNGIDAGEGCNVVGNTVAENISYGLFLGDETAYRGNAITTPNLFTVQGGVNAGGNSCGGSLCL
jgi:hypothetical protein